MLYFQQREPLQQKLKSCRVWGSRSASAPFLHQPRWPAWLVKYGQITPPPRAARHGGGPRPAVDWQSRAVACSQLPCINTSSSSRSDCTDMSYGLTWNKSARIVSFACGGGGGVWQGCGQVVSGKTAEYSWIQVGPRSQGAAWTTVLAWKAISGTCGARVRGQ